MRARVQKWGNSLALRIPRGIADEAGLKQNELVQLSLVDGRLLVAPVREPPTLEELLAGVTEENVHHEVDTGPSVGNEVW